MLCCSNDLLSQYNIEIQHCNNENVTSLLNRKIDKQFQLNMCVKCEYNFIIIHMIFFHDNFYLFLERYTW